MFKHSAQQGLPSYNALSHPLDLSSHTKSSANIAPRSLGIARQKVEWPFSAKVPGVLLESALSLQEVKKKDTPDLLLKAPWRDARASNPQHFVS